MRDVQLISPSHLSVPRDSFIYLSSLSITVSFLKKKERKKKKQFCESLDLLPWEIAVMQCNTQKHF